MTLASAFYLPNQEENMYSIRFRDVDTKKPRFLLDHHGAFIGKKWDVNLNNFCLKGFRPKFEDEWSKENWSGGCVRITQLECQNTSLRNSDVVGDGFLKLGSMKVPDYASFLLVTEMEECKKICLENCSCLAYSHDGGIGCMTWGEHLVDMQNFTQGGKDLYIRLAPSDIDK
ncbi:hypothetical protein MKW92_006370 [Papaver armeniacum]|nr:hypothetical protein MKW92_006370 [Papaver armeniacum]